MGRVTLPTLTSARGSVGPTWSGGVIAGLAAGIHYGDLRFLKRFFPDTILFSSQISSRYTIGERVGRRWTKTTDFQLAGTDATHGELCRRLWKYRARQEIETVGKLSVAAVMLSQGHVDSPGSLHDWSLGIWQPASIYVWQRWATSYLTSGIETLYNQHLIFPVLFQSIKSSSFI